MNTGSAPDLGSLLFGAYRRQVLGLLLLHPDEAFHLREIARITRTQPGTLRRELALLTAAGVITQEKLGNLVRFQADSACPIFEELRGILKKTTGVADVIRAALEPMAGRIRIAFIFGSVSRGIERRASDLDVLIVGDVRYEDVISALLPCQNELRREINPVVMSAAEFARKRKEADSFVARVMRQPKLPVLGNMDDLEES